MKRRHKLPAFSVLQLSLYLSNVNHSNPPTKLESGGEQNEISSHGTFVVLTLKCVNVSCWQIFRECVKSWLRLSAADHFPQLKIWCWKPMELIENFFGVIRGIGSWAGSSTSSSFASPPLSSTPGLTSTSQAAFQQPVAIQLNAACKILTLTVSLLLVGCSTSRRWRDWPTHTLPSLAFSWATPAFSVWLHRCSASAGKERFTQVYVA